MPLRFLPVFLIPIVFGCNGSKNETEGLIENCIDACEPYVDFMMACGFELGATGDVFCEDRCSDAERAVETDCTSEFEALSDCNLSLNWADAECTEDVVASKLAVCNEKESRLQECMVSDTGEPGDDDGAADGDDDGGEVDGGDDGGSDDGGSDGDVDGDEGSGDDGGSDDGEDGSGDDGGTVADVMPEVGSWNYTSFDVTSTSCAGVSDEVVSGLSGSAGFSISDATASGFVWQIDGFSESSECTQSGFDFNCDPASGNIDNEYAELPTLINTQGTFSDERTLSGTYEASINCSGPLCATVEAVYAISFPCDFDFSFSASPI